MVHGILRLPSEVDVPYRSVALNEFDDTGKLSRIYSST